MSVGLIVSEEFQDSAERITAGVKHDVVVIPVQHIGTGHISQFGMEHIILESVSVCNRLHVCEVVSIAHNQVFLPSPPLSLARISINLLHQVRHHTLHRNHQRDKHRVDDAIMREMLLEEDHQRLVEGVHILDGILLRTLTLVV